MTAFSFKEEFSVLMCLKTFKIIFLSPELIALHLIAVDLLDTRDFILWLLENAFNSFPFLDSSTVWYLSKLPRLRLQLVLSVLC